MQEMKELENGDDGPDCASLIGSYINQLGLDI